MTTSNKTKITSKGSWLVVEGVQGLTIAPANTPLTRLNYYDGKRLDASALQLEQDAQRRLVHLSNLAGGFGIVHGFDTRLAGGDLLEVGPGQAIDAEGRLLLLPQDVQVAITELIARSQATPTQTQTSKPGELGPSRLRDCEIIASEPPGEVSQDGCLWLITIAHAEFACGEEDVYGKLCEQACVTSIERAFRVEGVVLRARRLELGTLPSSGAVALTDTHLRSRVASAYYANERKQPASMISGAGLRSEVWCHGAELAVGEVALGVLCRRGMSNRWFDAWTARRERIESPARVYWAHRMAMRSWPEFLAQVLQFQCQLSGLLGDLSREDGILVDPCADDAHTIAGARSAVDSLIARWSEDEGESELRSLTIDALDQLRGQLELSARPGSFASGKRILIDGGVIELPPAGYLPVDPSSSRSVNDQIKDLLGEGVSLRFCVVRPDDVARELEGAQHMDRISLLRGLDDPSAKPPVDILVPDGELIERTTAAEGLSFRAKLGFGLLGDEADPNWRELVTDLDRWLSNQSRFRGAARATRAGSGGEVQIAALMEPGTLVDLDVEQLAPISDFPGAADLLDDLVRGARAPVELDTLSLANVNAPPGELVSAVAQPRSRGLWIDMSCTGDPLTIPLGLALSASFLVRLGADGRLIEYRLSGSLRVTTREDLRDDNNEIYGRRAIGTLTGAETQTGFGGLAATSTSQFNVTILDLRPSGSTNALLVSLSPVRGRALLDNDVVVAWDGESLEVSGLWVIRPVSQASVEPQLVFSDLEPDPGVLAEADPDHRAALEALSAIANAMDDTGFVKEAAAKLFPPTPSDGVTLEVQAVHDWVLFHARHHKQCSLEPSPRPTPERPRYRVFTREVPSPEALEALVELLINDARALEELAFTEVGLVEYEPGVATLASTPAAIEALWKPHGSERSLAWAGIASAAANGQQLARTRLLALEEVVETISPALEQQASMVLPGVPRAFELGDAQGVVVLLTAPRQAPLRLSLYVASSASIERLLEIPELAQPNAELSQLLEGGVEATHVGDFEIAEGQVINFTPDQAGWSLRDPTQVVAYTRSDDPSRPRPAAVEAAAAVAFRQLHVEVEIAGVPFAHLQFPSQWSSELGDVVVVGCGEIVRESPGPL